jgi:2-succinyl-5-enolpyruvyl-6-hydroxy-3-cyclohexene-1-carboxylate synthase
MGPGDVSLACVSAMVDELVGGGLRHACVSPGSRSTPIALALARHPYVTVHIHLDERASAFFALGIAKATGRPVAVACTSGTAAANFLPAVVEASQTRVPMIVLTADRPARLRGSGANQTIDQAELYGRYVRWFVDAPLPAEAAEDGWRALGGRAVSAALGTTPGPVHVNLPFEEPLTPEGPKIAGDGGAEPPNILASPPQTSGAPLAGDVDRAAIELASERGVVVIGSMPVPPLAAVDLAERLCWPVVAEPTSGVRLPGVALAAGQFLLGSGKWIDAHRPEVVLQLGATPTTRATQAFVASAARLIVVDRFHPDPDPEHRARWKLRADPDALAESLFPRLPAASAPTPLAETWSRADAAARATIDALLDSWDEPFEGRVARDLAAAAPDGATLVVGSSMPVRDLDAFMAPRDGLRVLANRGSSGIDGFVSTTLGVAATGQPTYSLCGDLTLLHDAGSLLWSARRGLDAVFVVPNNGGGAVFSFLPQRVLPEHEELFTTPHGLDLGAICAAAGAGHVRIERAGQLVPAVERAATARGVHVIEVPSDGEHNVARHAEVQAAVDAALA